MKISKLYVSLVLGLFCLALSSARAAEPTALQLIKEGNRYIGEPSKDKVIGIYSDKSLVGLVPTIWYVDYYDPDARGKIVEVKFGSGLKLDVKRPMKLFGGGGDEGNALDLKKLKVDSNAAINTATSQQMLKPLTLKSTQLRLERGDDGVVWKVRIWAAKLKDTNAAVNIGDIFISPEDGKIIRADLHIERVN